LSTTRNKSSGSVRIFYPRWTRETLIRYLGERLPLLAGRLPLVRVVLFGSYARGRATATSDVDLLVVYDGTPRDDAYAVVRTVLDLRGLEPHVYALAEYVRMRPALDRMTRDGVVLFAREPERGPFCG
jgi:predicted nucleotidyltransferase